MIKIIKDGWYVEDQIRPSPGRNVHLVLDLLTNENILKLPLLKDIENRILKLEIYGVNLGRQLTYLKDKHHLMVDLGDLTSWTSTSDSRGLTKVRLDFKFNVTDPNFYLSRLDLGYETYFELSGYKLNKGSITVPLGLKIKNDGEIKVESILKYEDKEEISEDVFVADHMDTHNKRKRYHFLVTEDIRKQLDSEDFETEFRVSYKTVNERKFLIIPMVSIALLILALVRSYGLLLGITKFDIRYLAASVAFLGLILNFVRDGYELPLMKLIFVSVLILIVELSLELIFLPFG